MTRDVPIDRSAGTVVLSWKSSEGGLLLRVHGQADDVRLICRCGRCHWIVHEDDEGKGAILDLTCHHCGTRITFALEGARAAAR